MSRRDAIDALLDDLADRLAARLGTDHQTPLPVTWTVQETMRQTGLGRDAVYRLAASGEIDTLRLDPDTPRSKVLVVPESVLAWRDRQAYDSRPSRGRGGIGPRADTTRSAAEG